MIPLYITKWENYKSREHEHGVFFSTYLFFGSELIKHLLDLLFPVFLQGVEGIFGHFKETRLFYGGEMV